MIEPQQSSQKHRDGDFIAKVLDHFKIMPVRGSTNRGARSALIDSSKGFKERRKSSNNT